MGNFFAAGLLACCSDGAFSARRPMASCHREKQLTVAGQRRTLTGFPIVRTQARRHPFLGASRLCGTASDCKFTNFSRNDKAPAAAYRRFAWEYRCFARVDSRFRVISRRQKVFAPPWQFFASRLQFFASRLQFFASRLQFFASRLQFFANRVAKKCQ